MRSGQVLSVSLANDSISSRLMPCSSLDHSARRPRLQHTSVQLARSAREHNVAHSVGHTAVCWGNARDESFWATMKVGFYDRNLWPTKAVAKLAFADWWHKAAGNRWLRLQAASLDHRRFWDAMDAISKDWSERVYNRRRGHSSIGVVSPVDFENRLMSRLTLSPPNGSSPGSLNPMHVSVMWMHAGRRCRRNPKMAVSRGPSGMVSAHRKPVGRHHHCSRHRSQ